MPRLLGVDIPNDRPTAVSLTYLYGVGLKTARELCHKAGIDGQLRARDLKEDELGRLAALLDKRTHKDRNAIGHSRQTERRRPAIPQSHTNRAFSAFLLDGGPRRHVGR